MYNFEQCGLLPRMSLPQKDLFVMCDGESMWRLLSNSDIEFEHCGENSAAARYVEAAALHLGKA